MRDAILERALKKLNDLEDDELTFRDFIDVQTIIKNAKELSRTPKSKSLIEGLVDGE